MKTSFYSLRRGKETSAMITLFLAFICAVNSTAQPNLTGISVFGADATGNYSPFHRWSTTGGDVIYNMYVTQPNTGIGGAFINSGNGAGTSLNFPLAPGTLDFYMFGEPGNFTPY